jgi:hypothetical protein
MIEIAMDREPIEDVKGVGGGSGIDMPTSTRRHGMKAASDGQN